MYTYVRACVCVCEFMNVCVRVYELCTGYIYVYGARGGAVS
jgi:hypothetical protein